MAKSADCLIIHSVRKCARAALALVALPLIVLLGRHAAAVSLPHHLTGMVDRIVGALANLGHEISDQTVGNVLRRHGIPPAPKRKHTTTWPAFIRTHLAVLAGTDFFTVEVLTLHGLVTYYVLFFIHLASRRVEIAGITTHPTEQWMKQMARNVTMEGCGALGD